MNSLEEIYLLLAVLITALVLGLYFFSRIRNGKTRKAVPNSSVVLVLAILLTVLVAKYSQERPYHPMAVVFSVVLSVVGIGLFTLLLWPFRDLKIFIREKKYATIRFFAVAFLYSIYFAIVSRGFSFLFHGIINPQTVILTPEFERYIIPTLSISVLAIYRLTKVFSSKATEFLGELSRDVVMFSLMMFWLGFSVSIIGIKISVDLSFQPSEESALLGVIAGITSVGLEGVLLWIKNDLSKTGRRLSVEQAIRSFFPIFTPKREKNQKTLDMFYTEPIAQKTSKGLNRASKILDSRFSLHYRGHVLRASRLLTLAISLISILFIGVFMSTKDVVVLAPAYSVELDLFTETQLPFDTEVITSECMESLVVVDKFYAIPIVSIQSSNSSFEAPLSNRFIFINSSQFMVLKTGQYLVIRLTETHVETHVRTTLIPRVDYNQTNNTHFDHRGFFREAEIFYCLEQFGYDQITTLSVTSLQGFITVVQKSIFAYNSTGSTASVYIVRRSETGIIEDKTCFTSLNENFMSQTIFLIKQTKLMTTCIEEITNAIIPFRLVDNP